MTFKVVFDAAGNVVAYGPDTPEYSPSVPHGGRTEIAANAPPPPSDNTPQDPIEKLRAFLAMHPDVVAALEAK